MTHLDTAKKLDKEDNPILASQAYERAIQQENVDKEIYLDLAVLYFECNDFGFINHRKLPETFIKNYSGRWKIVLEKAEKKFGNQPELDFGKDILDLFYMETL